MREKRRLRFPLFLSLEGREILIIGAGRIAARRARVLLPFGAGSGYVRCRGRRNFRKRCGVGSWRGRSGTRAGGFLRSLSLERSFLFLPPPMILK
ncbi:MAG: NAD(P)-dependent oxidoreductase [Sellimonas intestinalis]|uniref:NAD(P)-dependent oxidoreductase n=1 Tax=Sellimonas intestinalis TaxID=1653434 RepID=UPI0039A2BD46